MNQVINKSVKVISLGTRDYQEAWDYQEDLFKQTVDVKIANRKLPEDQQQKTPNYLIYCDHPHVYTLGKSGSKENLLLNEEGLKEKDAQYYKINRGGDITYHGPGQLVCYPILDLDNFFEDIHKYLRFLEQAVIDTLQEYNVAAGRIKGLTGVWLDYDQEHPLNGFWQPRKICAMGVKSSRWVTMHGLALNVNTQLEYFENIVPCGIDDKAVTSLAKEIQQPVDMKEVESKLTKHLANLFEMELKQ